MSEFEDRCKQAKEMAVYNFYHGLSCSESVYEALLRSGVIDEADAAYSTVALCAGLGGGIGTSGLSCGALSGAAMAVGSKHGRKDPRNAKPDGLYDGEYLRYNNMVQDFVKIMGSGLCRDIVAPYSKNYHCPERKDHCAEAIAAGIDVACKYISMSIEEVKKLSWGPNVAGNK
jgi:C_GCAxxG_C_C family probable redox protein